jgi:DNA repair protein RecN (Recombination protein N)
MLRRIALRDFVIVSALDLDLHAGFTALTGETGAGKSILIDALQLALGQRADALVVREGAARADISVEFDAPASLQAWLVEAGFTEADEPTDSLLCRRVVDAQGKSRAWINGHPATLAQLREAADHLVDIHGQHAWQSLTRPDAVRGLLDGYAALDAHALHASWSAWRDASAKLADARARQSGLEAERERLQWQIAEIDKLAPASAEWPEINAEQRRLSHAQAILDAIHSARQVLSEGETGDSADAQLAKAIDALDAVVEHDSALCEPLDVLRSAQAQLQDAVHTLGARLRDDGPDPDRLRALDDRLADWMSLARRFRRPPEELPALLSQWRGELVALDAATDLDALEREERSQRKLFDAAARNVSAARRAAAPKLAAAVTQAMQQLGMAGGRFEIALEPLAEPQRHGLEAIEFRVAGHAGSTPRALAKVASGGELSRIALAIAVTTSQTATQTAASAGEDAAIAATLIFDEIDSGVGGQVADAVGRLMRRLGHERQVLCVTHLPQVAACADHHCVVRKATAAGRTTSEVQPLEGDERAAEIARMLGGDRAGETSLAHARALIQAAFEAEPLAPAKAERRKLRA